MNQEKEHKIIIITRKTFEITTSCIIAIGQGIRNAITKQMRKK